MREQVADPPYDRSVLEKKPRPSLKLIHIHKLKNIPGFVNVGIQVTTPPSGATPPHRHGGASVSGHIVSGKAYNKMNDEPTFLLTAGEAFYEAPGCHHRISANASETEEMVLFASMLVEEKVIDEQGIAGLVILDEGFEDLVPHL